MDRLDCLPGTAPDFAPIDLAGASGEPDARPEPTRIWDSMRIWDPQIRDIPFIPLMAGVSEKGILPSYGHLTRKMMKPNRIWGSLFSDKAISMPWLCHGQVSWIL